MHLTVPNATELQIFNDLGLQFPQDLIEEDYFLTAILKIIAESPLGERLAFKGGNAVNRVYCQPYRFSNDLDFEAIDEIAFDDITRLFSSVSDIVQIDHEYVSIPSFRLHVCITYQTPSMMIKKTKIDINNHSKLLCKPEWHQYNNSYGLDFDVLTMDIKELAAEKIRAMNGRAEYRDFYDFTNLMLDYSLHPEEIVELFLEKPSLFPKDYNRLLQHWCVVLEHKEDYLRKAFYAKPLEDALIQAVVQILTIPETCDWKRKREQQNDPAIVI